MIQQTIQKLRDLKLHAMVAALESNLGMPAFRDLSLEEQLSVLIESESNSRVNTRFNRMLKNAKFRYPSACLEEVSYKSSRGLDKMLFSILATGDWVRQPRHVIMTGPTGTGKSWLACALGIQACRNGMSALYRTSIQISDEITEAVTDGSLPSLKTRLIKASVLVLDDLGIMPFNAHSARTMLDVIDERDRQGTGALIITSQYPIELWHQYLGDSTVAEAILDRIAHNAYHIDLKGESMRKQLEK